MDQSRICHKVNDQIYALKLQKEATIESSIKNSLSWSLEGDTYSVLVTQAIEAQSLLAIVKEYGFETSAEDLKSIQVLADSVWGKGKWGEFKWS